MMDQVLLTNSSKIVTESSYHSPGRSPHHCIRTPTPGVSRFSRNTTTYIFLKEEYHNWLVENYEGEYTLKQRLEDGHRLTYLMGDATMLMMFKLTWL